MMMSTFSACSVLLSTLLVVSHGQLSQPGSSSGGSLRLNSLQETTNWDLLEDLFLYHNAIRFFHNSRGIQFNRTVSFSQVQRAKYSANGEIIKMAFACFFSIEIDDVSFLHM